MNEQEMMHNALETNDRIMGWLKQNGHNDSVQNWWLENADFFTALILGSNEPQIVDKIKLAFTFGCYLGWNESR